jgi:heme O synthase-like polyprenyltransferase
MPVTQKTKGSFRQIYSGALAILAVGLMACVYILSNKLIVGAAGIILIALLLWSFITIRKNKNIDAKTKTSSWLVFIVIITVVVIMFQKITN